MISLGLTANKGYYL